MGETFHAIIRTTAMEKPICSGGAEQQITFDGVRSHECIAHSHIKIAMTNEYSQLPRQVPSIHRASDHDLRPAYQRF